MSDTPGELEKERDDTGKRTQEDNSEVPLKPHLTFEDLKEGWRRFTESRKTTS